MTKGLKPKRVTRTVGMNPIARAVAREHLRKAILDYKIHLYLLVEGEPCAHLLVPIQAVFNALITAASRDPEVGAEVYEVRILRGAASACEQMIENNSYRQINTTTLDVGLDCAAELNKRVNPELFNQAWNELIGGVR